MIKKMKLKNNYIRKKRKTYRKKRKTYRKKRKKTHKKKLQGGAGIHRIGFELEACFHGKHTISKRGRSKFYCAGLRPGEEHSVRVKDGNALVDLFTKELKYFDAIDDGSIECSREGDNPPCRMELVLSEDNVFTYNDKQIYMDGVDITPSLIEEIFLISSKAEPCLSDCGFHVHISETDEKYRLDKVDGKIFLLRVLALWCGIEGVTIGEQTEFIKKGYVRTDATSYAELLKPLDRDRFETVYKLALADVLPDSLLIQYIITQVYSDNAMKYRSLNIYSFGTNETEETLEVGEFKGWSEILRIEFRGHKDLMEKIMDNTDTSSPSESSVSAITNMVARYNPENTRNLAKASRFLNHLMEYLEDINSFFEKAKTYEPPI